MSIFQSVGRFFGFNQNHRYYTLQSIGNVAPDWIQTTELFDIYGRIPELNTVINRKANMIASANPIVVDANGAKVAMEDLPPDVAAWLPTLIDRPTPMLSWGNMVKMLSINLSVTGNAIAYAPKRSFGYYTILVPIAFNNVKIHANKKGYKQLERSGVIEKFEIPIDNTGQFEPFLPNEIIYIFEPDGINLMNAKSRLENLKMPLSNIEKQYTKRNVILKNVFALGMLSAGDSIDAMGNQPVKGDDIEKIRESVKKRHQDEIILTDKKMDYKPMTFPTKDLMLYEENVADFITICNAYGLKSDIFGDILGKGSTFSNVDGAERQTYTATIIPESEFIYDELTQQMGLDKFELYLKPDFSHIDILKQSDALHEKTKVEKLSKMLADGVISAEEYATQMGVEYIPPSKEDLAAQSLANAQINLRGTVGGLNGVIDLNRAVSDGSMTRDAAIATLITYYGYDSTTANNMITLERQNTVDSNLEA